MLTAAQREVLLLSHRMGNWARLQPLFQSYIDTFGADLGGRVVRYIAKCLGGCRISFPEKLSNNSKHSDSWETLNLFYNYLCVDFGDDVGQVVMKRMFSQLRGCRITFLRLDDLFRIERDEHIRRERREHCTGVSVLAERYGLDEVTIWRILREG